MREVFDRIGRVGVYTLVAAVCGAMCLPFVATAGGDVNAVVAEPQPVDKSMHHFMEYVFEPNYKRLKVGMAAEPNDKKAWKAIKGDSLTLAEGSNLLLLRAPDKNTELWKKQSLAVRKHGAELYQAARKSDYAAARAAYVTMLNNCNACHEHFADGKYQLKP